MNENEIIVIMNENEMMKKMKWNEENEMSIIMKIMKMK